MHMRFRQIFTLGPGACTVALWFACSCVGDDSSTTVVVGADGGPSMDGGTPGADTGADDGSRSDGNTPDGSTTDSGGSDPAGPKPTKQCTIAPDANGFFKLTSAMSDYWVRLPVGYDVLNPQPAPLVVALHGCGDTALNFATYAAVPPSLRATQSYIALAVGGREGACWTTPQDGPIVTAAIAHLRGCIWAHQKKIVIAGYSSGGELAYALGLANAASYAGLLIENSGLSQAVGAANVDAVLAAAAWKINVAQSARTGDATFPIGITHADRDKMIAAGFPLQYRELAGDNTSASADWDGFLLPKIATWVAP